MDFNYNDIYEFLCDNNVKIEVTFNGERRFSREFSKEYKKEFPEGCYRGYQTTEAEDKFRKDLFETLAKEY